MRGSGGSTYGIALSMTFKLYPAPGKVTLFNGAYIPNNTLAH